MKEFWEIHENLWNVRFYETWQLPIFAYTRAFVGIFYNWIFFPKNCDLPENFWKIHFEVVNFEIYPENGRDAENYSALIYFEEKN